MILTTGLKKCEWFSLTFVFLSTHSSHERVGLFRFCFFLGGSSKAPSSVLSSAGEAEKVPSVVAGDMAVYTCKAGDMGITWPSIVRVQAAELGINVVGENWLMGINVVLREYLREQNEIDASVLRGIGIWDLNQ